MATAAIVPRTTERPSGFQNSPRLSPQVLPHSAFGSPAGLSNKEIGFQLHISEKTVKHYMTNILQKLQVRNRVEAALIAQRQGDKIKKG